MSGESIRCFTIALKCCCSKFHEIKKNCGHFQKGIWINFRNFVLKKLWEFPPRCLAKRRVWVWSTSTLIYSNSLLPSGWNTFLIGCISLTLPNGWFGVQCCKTFPAVKNISNPSLMFASMGEKLHSCQVVWQHYSQNGQGRSVCHVQTL